MSKQKFKVGDRVVFKCAGYPADHGQVTIVSDDASLGYLVEWDEPVDSGDGVLSYDQWVEAAYLVSEA